MTPLKLQEPLAAPAEERRRPSLDARGRGGVMHVVSGLFYGGGQRVALELRRCTPIAAGGKVELCVLGDRDTRMAAAATHRVEYDGRYNRPLVLLKAARGLRRVIRAAGPKLVHSHGWDASVITALACIGAGMPHVIHWHTTDAWLASGRMTHRIRRAVTRLLLGRRGEGVVAVSRASCEHLRACLGWENAAVAANGVDTEAFHDRQQPAGGRGRDGAIVIGTAARLSAPKGLEYLLRAAAKLVRTGVNIELRIAGDGNHRAALEREARLLGIADRVTFLGHVEEPAGFYRGLDLFVLPSLSEGMPLSVLEAMSCGCAVVATRVGGLGEIVREGVTGLLVPTADADALAGAMAQLVSDASRRREFGRAARQCVVDGFSCEQMARRVAEHYERVLGGRDAR